MMISEMLCPDCGGVVGATEASEAGPPCRCFVADPEKEKQETVSDEPVVVAQKLCRICGKDLTGHKRIRDRLGYYCPECSEAEKKKETQGRVRCRVCGHLTREESLTVYEGTKMCPRCHGERIEAQKQVIKRIGYKGARTREEVRQLKKLLLLLGMLLIVMAYGAWRTFRH